MSEIRIVRSITMAFVLSYKIQCVACNFEFRCCIYKFKTVSAGGKRIGPNPKINNLMPAYESMKYNLFWICDSGIQVHSDTLRDLASKMTDNVALVHAAPYASNRKGFSGAIEKVCPCQF